MASAEAFGPIETYLRANWTATALVFENEDWPTPETPAPFIFVEVDGDLFSQQSLGAGARDDNLWREAGTLRLHVLAPVGGGSLVARQYARQAADLFRGKDVSGITFGDASLGAGEPGTADGNYWRFTATIDWERDE